MTNIAMFRVVARRGAALTLAAALALTPTLAAAESCSDLSSERDELHGEMARLIVNYPGTHIVIAMCAAGAQSNYRQNHDEGDAVATFVVCAGIGCAFAGFDNCSDVTKQWFILALHGSQVDDRMRQQGCSQ